MSPLGVVRWRHGNTEAGNETIQGPPMIARILSHLEVEGKALTLHSDEPLPGPMFGRKLLS